MSICYWITNIYYYINNNYHTHYFQIDYYRIIYNLAQNPKVVSY